MQNVKMFRSQHVRVFVDQYNLEKCVCSRYSTAVGERCAEQCKANPRPEGNDRETRRHCRTVASVACEMTRGRSSSQHVCEPVYSEL